MTHALKITTLALALSLMSAGGAMACGKDKDGKMECCCDKMKGDDAKGAAAMPAKPDAAKPGVAAPAKPDAHAEHQH